MVKFQATRTGDYPTLGFRADTADAILDGTLSTPELTIPPDATWSVYGGGDPETGITRYTAPSATPVTPAPEVEAGWILAYDDDLNTYVPIAPENVLVEPAWDAATAALVGNEASLTGTALSAAIDGAIAKGRPAYRETTLEEHGAVGDGVTDDTDAFIAALNYVSGAAVGVILLQGKTYLCNGPQVTTQRGNAILPIPATGAGVIKIIGIAPGMNFAPQNPQEGLSVIKTTVTGRTYSGTDGVPSLIGGPTDLANRWFGELIIKDVVVWLPADSSVSGVDANGIGRLDWDGSIVVAFDQEDLDWTEPTHVYQFGLRTPFAGNWNKVMVRSGASYGCYAGLVANVDHLTLGYWSSKWNVINVALSGSGGHVGVIGNLSSELAQYHISGWDETVGVSSFGNFGAAAPVHIAAFDIEDEADTGKWWATLEHVHDPTNSLRGVINFSRISDGYLVTASSLLGLDGAYNVEFKPLILSHQRVGKKVEVDLVSTSALTDSVGDWQIDLNTDHFFGTQLYKTTGSANDRKDFGPVWFDRGTYTLDMYVAKNPASAVVSVVLNPGTTTEIAAASFDLYAASGTVERVVQTGIAVTYAGYYTVRVATPTKNASSSDWQAYLAGKAVFTCTA